jgi:hypothetical protein
MEIQRYFNKICDKYLSFEVAFIACKSQMEWCFKYLYLR